MSMKVTVPWQIRMPAVKSGSPRSRNWWNRQHYSGGFPSTPVQSVIMKKDDLDHLGTKHQIITSSSRPHRMFDRIFRRRG